MSDVPDLMRQATRGVAPDVEAILARALVQGERSRQRRRWAAALGTAVAAGVAGLVAWLPLQGGALTAGDTVRDVDTAAAPVASMSAAPTTDPGPAGGSLPRFEGEPLTPAEQRGVVQALDDMVDGFPDVEVTSIVVKSAADAGTTGKAVDVSMLARPDGGSRIVMLTTLVVDATGRVCDASCS